MASKRVRLGHVTAPARMEAVNLIARLGVGIASCSLAARQQKPPSDVGMDCRVPWWR